MEGNIVPGSGEQDVAIFGGATVELPTPPQPRKKVPQSGLHGCPLVTTGLAFTPLCLLLCF